MIRKNSRPNKRPKKNNPNARMLRVLNAAGALLSEHASSFQIVGTVLNPNGSTAQFRAGEGDLLARCKAAELFVEDTNMML
jgi:hypothetical protein